MSPKSKSLLAMWFVIFVGLAVTLFEDGHGRHTWGLIIILLAGLAGLVYSMRLYRQGKELDRLFPDGAYYEHVDSKALKAWRQEHPQMTYMQAAQAYSHELLNGESVQHWIQGDNNVK